MKRKKYKTLAFALAFMLASSSFSLFVNGAPPSVTVDETLYVNLDYYGATTALKVVKGCTLNGNDEFIDYGDYDSVLNMSNTTDPVIDGNAVTWKFSRPTEQFFFEATPKQVELPWTFDVSYKLNGAEIAAEKLAGASGVIETTIHAIPNPTASTYYKNNMLLTVAAIVDMDKNISVEAEGAQIQSLGTEKAIAFIALPQAEETFTLRIGTNSYESNGIFIMMAPGTLSDLEKIKDLKESKDTIQDSTDALNESLDDLLDTIDGMTNGLANTKSGLADLNTGREVISGAKGQIYGEADIALADLTAITDNMQKLIPHLQNGQTMVNDICANLMELSSTLNRTKTNLTDIQTAITAVQADLENIKVMMDDIEALKDDRIALTDALKDDTEDLKNRLDDLEQDLSTLALNMNNLKRDVATISEADSEVQALMQAIGTAAIVSAPPEAAGIVGQSLNSASIQVSKLFGRITGLAGSSYMVLSNLQTTTEDLGQTFRYLKHITDDVNDAVSLFGEFCDILEEHHEDANDLIDQTNAMGDAISNLINNAKTAIDDINKISNTITNNREDTIGLLQDSEEIINSLTTGISDTQTFLTNFKDTLQKSGEYLDSGSQKALEGLINVLQQSIAGIGKTDSARNAKDTIKNTIDDKWDEYEEENNFLDLDTDSEMESFTSSLNQPPKTLQVVMRTQEISIDDFSDETADLETKPADVGIIARISAIFKKIFEAIVTIFQ